MSLQYTTQTSVIVGNAFTYGLAIVAVVLRLTARRLTNAKLWADDYLALGALVGATGYFVNTMIWVRNGLGQHYTELGQPYATVWRNTFLALFIDEYFYSTTTVFAKLSILAFYWRIFHVTTIRLPIKIIGAALIAWLLARYLGDTFHCTPINAYWDMNVQGHCGVKDRQFFMGTNTVNFVLDLVVLTLPLPYIHKLKIPKAQKLVVFGMFTLGAFICIASVILLIICYNLDQTSLDITYSTGSVALWAGTESNLAIVSACLPSMRPIYLFVFRSRATSRTRSQNAKSGASAYAVGSSNMTHTASKQRASRPFSGVHDSDSMNHPFTAMADESGGSDTNLGNAKEGSWDPVRKADATVETNSMQLDRLEGLADDKIMVNQTVRVDYSAA